MFSFLPVLATAGLLFGGSSVFGNIERAENVSSLILSMSDGITISDESLVEYALREYDMTKDYGITYSADVVESAERLRADLERVEASFKASVDKDVSAHSEALKEAQNGSYDDGYAEGLVQGYTEELEAIRIEQEQAEAQREQQFSEALIAAAESQLGVRYRSVHYGPKGDPFGNGEGFGCAMFVTYAYNTVLFDGHRGDDFSQNPHVDWFVGWTQSYWSSVADDNYGGANVGFMEVSADDAVPGDVICHLNGAANPYSTGNNCHHVSMYYGDGKEINGGGGSIHDFNKYQSNLHYLHYVGKDDPRAGTHL